MDETSNQNAPQENNITSSEPSTAVPSTQEASLVTPPIEQVVQAQSSAPTMSSQIPPNPPIPPTIVQSKQRIKIIALIVGGVLLLLLIIVLIIGHGKGKPVTKKVLNTSNNQEKKKQTVTTAPPFAKMLIYGTRNGQTSEIKTLDLATSKVTDIASLPFNIRKVSVLSNDTLLYIDKTDAHGNGTQLLIYDLKTKAPRGNIPASPGYSITDYVLSPDKKNLAIWEIGFPTSNQGPQGEMSRVYAMNLNSLTIQNLLYDEIGTPQTSIHYPRAILNSGTVFTDRFVPNDPAGSPGWGYGMSIVNFDGTNKQDVPAMASGTYGTQPILSPDGKYLLFSGYDGSHGDGNSSSSGTRQAILTPNTVEILDTQTLNRQKLPTLNNQNVYPLSMWDPVSGDIDIAVSSQTASSTGMYVFKNNQLTQIPLPATTATHYTFVSNASETDTLIGVKDTTAYNIGSLGETAAYPFTQLALFDTTSAQIKYLSLPDTFTQYITFVPLGYFK